MKKVYVIMPDNTPYSLCAKSFAKGFKHAGFFVEKSYSSELDNEKVLNFKPDYLMCFNFSELNEGFLEKVKKAVPDCIFIFDFLTHLNKKDNAKNIANLENFDAKKIVITADKSNVRILPNSKYIPSGINYRRYKTAFEGYSNGIVLMSNPDNINVLKIITDLISEFGKISFYANEFDYLNSLENELWSEITDPTIKEDFRASYKGDAAEEKQRAQIFSTSFITVVPITQTPEGVDFRVFEGAASSSFVICEENSEVKRLFDVGREIETYKNTSELNDKIRFYLKHPSFARTIADNARSAAVNNHSIRDRIRRILDIIKKKYEV